jgi:hypothetical protein
VYHSRPAIAPQGSTEPNSEWLSICAELQTKLPGEILEIESKRVRIEAVVAKLDIGNVLRHLTVTAKTPAEKEIVRYELNPLGSSSLASNLAAVLSRARDRNTRAEEVVGAISECLQRGGPYLMKKVIAESNPWIQLPMERTVPDFEEFARNPLSMDMSFTLERTIGNSHIRAVATLLPERRYTLVQAFTYPKGESSLPPSRTFKVRCPENFLSEPRTEQEIVVALHSTTWEAMNTIIEEGAATASEIFRDSGIDARLEQGEIEPMNCYTYHVLPSGARIMLEEGDSIGCIRIEASATEESASAFWRITSPLGLLLPENPRLITAHSAVGSLTEGDPRQKLEAIRTLDRMVNADADKLSPEARRVPPFSTLSIESCVGPQLAESLFRLRRCAVRPLPPTSEYAILDLIDGFQSVYLSHRDIAHTRMYPQDPDYLTFGLRSDGALKVMVKNPLRNHLDVVVPGDYFERHETRDACIERLARLFNRQSREGFMKLRTEMERLAGFASREVISSTALRPPESRFPTTADTHVNQALDTAAEVALVYEADASASISDVQMMFSSLGACDMLLTNTRSNPPIRMRLHVVADGISGIDLLTLGQTPGMRHSFEFLTPISLPEGRSVMTQLFRLFQATPQDSTPALRALAPSLTGTPLFRYLQECQERFDIQP